jgi:pilus assembly protein CpaC
VMQDGKVQAVEYKPYGVEVKFIPKILTKDKVMLFIEPNVVEAHYDYSPRVGSFNVPVMTRSHTRTKLQMKLGETMMIAGLMKDSFAASTSLGFFSPSTSFAKDSSEVVIIVTPYLVDNHLAEPVLPGEGMNEEAEIRKMLNRMAILSGNDDSKVGFMKE